MIIAEKTLEEWTDFARQDDCLEKMVPSDLRQLVSAIEEPIATEQQLYVYVSGMDEVHGPFDDELTAHREANGINATIMHSHSLHDDLKHMPHCVAKVVDHLDKCRLTASFLGLPHECNDRVGDEPREAQ